MHGATSPATARRAAGGSREAMVRLSQDPAVPEAVQGEYYSQLEAVSDGRMAAPAWKHTQVLRTMGSIQGDLNAAARKSQATPAVHKVTGQVSAAPKTMHLERMRAATGTARVLMLGCGIGWAAGTAACKGTSVTAVVPCCGTRAAVYRQNFDHPMVDTNLLQVDSAVRKLRRKGPFELAHISGSAFCAALSQIEMWKHMLASLQVVLRLGIRCVFIDNTLEGKSWKQAKKCLGLAGFQWQEADINAADCGVPQRRKRRFVVAVRSKNKSLQTKLDCWAESMARQQAEPLRRTLAEAIPGVGTSVFLRTKKVTQYVWPSTGQVPRLRASCADYPVKVDGEWVYEEKRNDCQPIKKATFLTVSELGVVSGFDPEFQWPEKMRDAAKVIAAALAPPMAFTVLNAAIMAGAVPLQLPVADETELWHQFLAEAPLAEITALFDGAVAECEAEAPSFSERQWADAAQTACEATRSPRRPRGEGAQAAPHAEALVPPRQAQAPETRDFRRLCVSKNLPVPRPADEIAAGWGDRTAHADLRGTRALLTPNSEVPAIVAARRRINNMRHKVSDGEPPRSGLWQPITGWPSHQIETWRQSGASPKQLDWLKRGFAFDLKGVVPPMGLAGGAAGNHKGATQYARWLHEAFAEFLVLGIVTEVPHRPKVVCPLNVIEKGDFKASDPKLCNRLRLLLDQRSLNDYLNTQRFRAETLHRARGLIEEGDVCLQWDLSSYFYTFATARKHRGLMGCTLGPEGPLGGRYFVWNAAPMGVSSSPWVAQSLGWVLAKSWRKLGMRLLWYCDDVVVWCKPHEAAAIAAFVEREFRDHGLLRNPTKSHPEARLQARVLGIDVDLAEMTFRVPDDKITKTVDAIEVMLAVRGPVQVRELAVATGRIMAMHVAVGDVARRWTRECYALIAKVTGVPFDASDRDLRVAWSEKTVLTSEVREELQFFVENLPGHRGTAIHASLDAARVTMHADTGDRAWGAILDRGAGERVLARAELTASEATGSSTARELTGQAHGLETFEERLVRAFLGLESALKARGKELEQRYVMLLCDSQSAVRVLEVGSSNIRLQRIVKSVFALALRCSFVLVPRWRRRSTAEMQMVDDLGKIDDCDYQLSPEAFASVEKRLGVVHTVDTFASSANCLVKKFFARYPCPGHSGLDFFDQDLRTEMCWVHPPRGLIARVVRQLQKQQAAATILVPIDCSAMWWPLVAPGARGTVVDGAALGRIKLPMTTGLILQGGVARVPRHYSNLLALQLDFRGANLAMSASPQWATRAMARVAKRA